MLGHFFKSSSSSPERPSKPRMSSVNLPDTIDTSYSEPPRRSRFRSLFQSSDSLPPAAQSRRTSVSMSRPRGISDATDSSLGDDDEQEQDDSESSEDDHRRHRSTSTHFSPRSRRDLASTGYVSSSMQPRQRSIPRPSRHGNADVLPNIDILDEVRKSAEDKLAQERKQNEIARMRSRGQNISLVKSKALIEQEKEWAEQDALKKEAQKHPNARITLVRSKAAIEEEQERMQEEQEREWREMDEAKKANRLAANPAPLKSCLKKTQSRQSSGFATPAPPSANTHQTPAYAANPQQDPRRSSTSYHSDAEQYRIPHRSRRTSNAAAAPPPAPPQQQPQQYHRPPQSAESIPRPTRADTYPPDPRTAQTDPRYRYYQQQSQSQQQRGGDWTSYLGAQQAQLMQQDPRYRHGGQTVPPSMSMPMYQYGPPLSAQTQQQQQQYAAQQQQYQLQQQQAQAYAQLQQGQGHGQGQQITPPGQASRYKKAHRKTSSASSPSSASSTTAPVSASSIYGSAPRTSPTTTVDTASTMWVHRHEDTILSWPLVNPADRPHNQPGCGVVYFDVAFDPRYVSDSFGVKVKRYNGEQGLSPLSANEGDMPICIGGLVPEIWVYAEELPWYPIHIQCSQGKNNLRVKDVLLAIYKEWSRPVTRSELEDPEKRGLKDRYEVSRRWYKQRCEDSPGLVQVELEKGICRVDLLGGRRIFGGLVPLAGQEGWWTLKMEKASKRR